MLASYSQSDKVNNSSGGELHSAGLAPSTMSTASSSLDYLYQAINLIEQSKNSSSSSITTSTSNSSNSSTQETNFNTGLKDFKSSFLFFVF